MSVRTIAVLSVVGMCAGAVAAPRLVDESGARLSLAGVSGNTMDAAVADLDGDGDLDVVLAKEFQPNVILLNDGKGVFEDASEELLPRASQRWTRDSEEVVIADFNADGALDLAFVSEDTFTNELYLMGEDRVFVDATDNLRGVMGKTNALLAIDLNGDGRADLVLGNEGGNYALINDGKGMFTDESHERMPLLTDTTQDIEAGDVDGDGDVDLVEGNEGRPRVLINDGAGRFIDESADRMDLIAGPEQTRQVALGDVDGDGDLDMAMANVAFPPVGGDRTDRLLLNNGNGRFDDVTAARWVVDERHTVDVKLVDLDGDGDLDAVRCFAFPGGLSVLINDGNGFFTDRTLEWVGEQVAVNTIDVEAADFDGDGRLDLYVCVFGGADRILLRRGE